MKNEQENTEDSIENAYQQYLGRGGVLNEKDYKNIINRMSKITMFDNKALVTQAELIASTSGIALKSSPEVLDQRIILYGILRDDTRPKEKTNYSQLSDQQLFAEALKILGDMDSLKKVIKAHPNIFHTTNIILQ